MMFLNEFWLTEMKLPTVLKYFLSTKRATKKYKEGPHLD